MLFAVEDTQTVLSILALGMSVISGAIASLFGYLNTKIKLQFDAEMAKLRQQITDCENHPEMGRIALAEKVKQLEKKVESLPIVNMGPLV